VPNTQKTATVKKDILTHITKGKIWLEQFILPQTKTIKYQKTSSAPEIYPKPVK
jgi:hypothetical protein